MTDLRCRHCGAPVQRFNYALGPQWMHVNPNASFPSIGKGTAWRKCRAETVADPALSPGGESDG